jgi:hypothetical protein
MWDEELDTEFHKKNEDFKFKLQETFDINDIKNIILKFNDEWNINTYRQEAYSVHQHTKSYSIFEVSNEWNMQDPFVVKQKSNNKPLLDLIMPIIKKLEEIHDGKVGKTLFIDLPPVKDVLPHTDKRDYLNMVRRHHIPIITNEKVNFFVGGESINMKEGECWEINNSLLHSVDNQGTTNRIHLMIDIMPNKLLGEKYVD